MLDCLIMLKVIKRVQAVRQAHREDAVLKFEARLSESDLTCGVVDGDKIA
jgi:hypothetical protein